MVGWVWLSFGFGFGNNLCSGWSFFFAGGLWFNILGWGKWKGATTGLGLGLWLGIGGFGSRFGRGWGIGWHSFRGGGLWFSNSR